MRKILRISSIIVTVCVLFAISSCTKDDAGMEGNKTIKGNITNVDGNVNSATVYITFDATQATANYNYSTTTDASGNYRFENLAQGNYFLDATYTDNIGISFGTPGVYVEINNQKKNEEIIVNMVLE